MHDMIRKFQQQAALHVATAGRDEKQGMSWWSLDDIVSWLRWQRWQEHGRLVIPFRSATVLEVT
jgi:hypothetical protein